MEEDEIKLSPQILHVYALHLTISIHQHMILLAIMAAALLQVPFMTDVIILSAKLLLSADVCYKSNTP